MEKGQMGRNVFEILFRWDIKYRLIDCIKNWVAYLRFGIFFSFSPSKTFSFKRTLFKNLGGEKRNL